MNAVKRPEVKATLCAETAADLMTPNPLSIRDDASVREAVAFLLDERISGAPVIDEAGRPVGVLTQTDILIHDRETTRHVAAAGRRRDTASGVELPGEWWQGAEIEVVDPTSVRELMTPVVFSVSVNMPAAAVIRQMLELDVHRLFVVGSGGVLVGVISAADVLRRLRVAV